MVVLVGFFFFKHFPLRFNQNAVFYLQNSSPLLKKKTKPVKIVKEKYIKKERTALWQK